MELNGTLLVVLRAGEKKKKKRFKKLNQKSWPCIDLVFLANFVEPIFLLQSCTQPDHHTEGSMQPLVDMRLA